MRLAGKVSSPELEVDMALAAYNLGTKLMRWTSPIDCDRVGVSSLTVYQYSDEEEVRPNPPKKISSHISVSDTALRS